MRLLGNIVIVFLFFIIIFSLFQNIRIDKEIKSIEKKVEIVDNRNNILKDALIEMSFLFTSSLPEIVKLNDGTFVDFENVVLNKTVVFRFFENSCSPCVRRELSNVRNMLIKKIPIIIIASFSSERKLKAILSEYSINTTVYNLDKTSFVLKECDQLSKAYYFILDENMKVNNLFIPLQSEDDLSDVYCDYVESIYIQ